MRLFPRARVAARPRLPAAMRAYVVGDIHGRLDLLDALLDRIDADIARRPTAQNTLIFLGDYIDRGAASAHVLDRLIEVSAAYDTICLKGNHEALMRVFLEDPDILDDWGTLGGFNTLLSYGLTPVMNGSPEQRQRIAKELNALVENSHRRFLNTMPLYHVRGDYLFVHAGLRPRIPLDRQVEADLLWIREDFILYEGQHEKFVVHGHTPVMSPDTRPNRINIDTGAYATGKLTCLVLEDAEQRFL
jgi:serine/threonine protein phosphatase 1